MTGLIDWCTERARMTLVFIAISIGAGILAYTGLPKEGAPNIDVPVLYISVPLPGVSASDSERLLVKPLETEMRGLEGLKEMTGIASESHGGLLLEFDFGWDKAATLAEVRDKLSQAEAEFPDDADTATITEINLSEFPVLVVSLSGQVPERTLVRLAKDLQREIEADPKVLEAELTGHRDEMVEVLIDPLKLESYGVTAADLLSVIDRNNRLVAAGAVESATASFSVSVPGSFETAAELFNLPVKVNSDRVVRLGDVTEIRRTFEDAEATARYNGQKSISLQVSKRNGENIILTVEAVRAIVDAEIARWPLPLQQAVTVDFSMDESNNVTRMVTQLEGSVATAVILVMIVVFASLGFRSALLVGIAIPSSFLLSFALMEIFGLPINNMVMFGLILAVGMLVDGAIVVVEYADKQIQAGAGPMRAYRDAAKRMFWPITASTATTLCAFLPMLFWPGMPGKFMGLLPVTLIFVLSASLIVALLFLPVIGGVSGRLTRLLSREKPPSPPKFYRRSLFGRLIGLIALNPAGPFIAIGVAVSAIVAVFLYYGEHQTGTEFFVKVEPERAIVYVRARGNISLAEADRMVRETEERVMAIDGVQSVFAFAGTGGLVNKSGQGGPSDAIGQVQLELAPWGTRRPGDEILAEIGGAVADTPGFVAELAVQKDGPQQGKPVQLELTSDNWSDLTAAVEIARTRFEQSPYLTNIDDSRPLPGIEWQIGVDRATAGRYGADVATVSPLVQLVTRGALLGTHRPDDVDEELEIRIRFPEEERLLSTLDRLKVSTNSGMVPLSNFTTRTAEPKLGEVNRRDGRRFFLVRADVVADAPPDQTDVKLIGDLERWIAEENPFPSSVSARFTGDREEQEDSMTFLGVAFAGALGMMFVILLAQFNSLYNALLILLAVVMSVAGVLVGMLVMGQKFSIIMTGTGIVALAGIVVNNNIVLIDTFQEYARRMETLEAIVRTAEARIRPVLLTTITTMAGLTPMMFAMSIDFAAAGGAIGALLSGSGWSVFFATIISTGAPTALWWVQLATAVVFGLGFATVLTLLVTPAALAARVWVVRGALSGWDMMRSQLLSSANRKAQRTDAELEKAFRAQENVDLVFVQPAPKRPRRIIRAAE